MRLSSTLPILCFKIGFVAAFRSSPGADIAHLFTLLLSVEHAAVFLSVWETVVGG